jgi:serine/threonine protein kinase
VDFGFARALEPEEVKTQAGRLRNSILFEKDPNAASKAALPVAIVEEEDEDASQNSEDLAAMVESMAATMRHNAFEATNDAEDEVMGDKPRKRMSGISMPLAAAGVNNRRVSTARRAVRSMSALGTKAYAAPEIRKKLRQKNADDFGKENAAMTECVADYGMIVDAYSVGWTLRVVMTGVPPNFTISEYFHEREFTVFENEDGTIPPVSEDCGCFKGNSTKQPIIIREPSRLPQGATVLIKKMTQKEPEDRMTVREAQLNPYIAGEDGEEAYSPPQGDVPSSHGDPVVPLKCATELSKITVQYHMN